MNQQNTRNNCSCNSCNYGRTPWSTREACSCGRRPWNTRNTCSTCPASRSSCPCTANTTWRNRSEGCSCGSARTTSCESSARIGNCSCESPRETRSGCPCSDARDGDCDGACNRGARNTGLLDGKSLAMVYSPYQTFESLYDPRQGLCNGTIFCGLDKPFYGDRRGC